MQARFITIEGGEGVGKSKFTQGLTQRLHERGIKFMRTYEPGGTASGDRIRQIFVSPPDGETLTKETEFLLVSAARNQHVATKVKPALASGRWVICDRYADSSRVYQGMLGGIAGEDLEQIVTFSTFGLQPDLTFLLDCDVDESMRRVKCRAADGEEESSRFDEEGRDYHQRIRDSYLEIMARFSQRYVKIDAMAAPEKMVEQAMEALKERFL